MKKAKVFLTSFGLVFIMVMLPHLGVRTHFLESPLPKKTDNFDQIIPKIEQTKNNYFIKQNPTLVNEALADQDYNSARSFIVTNYDNGEVIAQKNSTDKVPIASLAKIMTAVVALDLANRDEKFTVSEKAANEIPTKLALKPGDQLTLEELLKATLLVSANDCAQVIKEGIDQKYGEIFIRAMNEKAKFLGLDSSFFTTPQGFDEGGPYSSASDFAILVHYALSNYPLIADIVSQDHGELLPSPTHQKYEYLNNWNGLLGVYPGVKGVKIGNTDAAGYTTAVLSQRDEKRVLVVLLGAPGVFQRDLWAGELLDLGFSKFGENPVGVTQDQLKAKYASWKYFQ